jgi:excisionase family DNA binding protein
MIGRQEHLNIKSISDSTTEQVEKSPEVTPKPEQEDVFITLQEAADKLSVHKGTVSRWETNGKIKDNGITGTKRLISTQSILHYTEYQEEKDAKKDLADIQNDADNAPEWR